MTPFILIWEVYNNKRGQLRRDGASTFLSKAQNIINTNKSIQNPLKKYLCDWSKKKLV